MLDAAKYEPEPNSGCFLFTGALTSAGYGAVWRDGKMRLAHREAFGETSIPNGMVIDHKCRVRSCVNPIHMEVVTRGANVLRGDTLTARNAKKQTCPFGHPYSHRDANGKRACRPCLAEAHRRYMARKVG